MFAVIVGFDRIKRMHELIPFEGKGCCGLTCVCFVKKTLPSLHELNCQTSLNFYTQHTCGVSRL